MLITLENILPALQTAVPAFVVDPEWLEIDGTYLIFGDLARFICSEAEVLQYVNSKEEAFQLSHVPRSIAFLEKAIREGDSDVRDLITDCMEGFCSCGWLSQIKAYFGPCLDAQWKRSFEENK